MQTQTESRLVLVSHHLCPYVQRAAIALAEKGVAFDRVHIDLADKPDWFTAMSPLGKVPLLIAGEHVIFESDVILEYLEETQPNPLLPPEPWARARHRGWAEFASQVLDVIAGLYSAPDADGFGRKADLLRDRFTRLEVELDGGRWFAGESFSVVDAAFAPVFRYFDVFERVADLGLLEGLDRTAAWRARLANRPSVRDAVTSDYGERLRAFLARRDSHMGRLAAGNDEPVTAG